MTHFKTYGIRQCLRCNSLNVNSTNFQDPSYRLDNYLDSANLKLILLIYRSIIFQS